MLALGAPADAAERAVQLRTIEDPTLVDAGSCAAQPFVANVQPGGGAWSARTRAGDGDVVNEEVRQVGAATVCARIADLTFEPFDGERPVQAAARFALEDGLASCILTVVAAPGGVLGGSVTSASVFDNPSRLPGFDTGSYWTLRLSTKE